MLKIASYMERSNTKELDIAEKPITLFDIDNTLVNGFTIFPFADFLATKGLMQASTLRIMHDDLTKYERKQNSYYDFAVDVVNHYAEGLNGVPQKDIVLAGYEYFEIYLTKLLPYAEKLVSQMNMHGVTIAVSGAPQEAFLPMARHLEMSHVYLLQVEYENGVCSGKVKVNMALDEEKLKVVNSLTLLGFSKDQSFSFGDSTGDLPILEAVTNPFTVNPNDELRKIALERNWPVVTDQTIIELVRKRLAVLKID